MKETERIKRINEKLNKHFTSNHDAWWVSNGNFSDSGIIELHHGIGGNRIKGVAVAKYILSTEKSVRIVHYGGGCLLYTRESVKNYAPRKNKYQGYHA
jgi:hypothetical protein